MTARFRIRAVIVVLCLSTLTAACIGRTYHAEDPIPGYVVHRPAVGNPSFAYTPANDVVLSDPIGRTRFHELRSLSFHSSGDNGQPGDRIDARYFKSLRPGPHRLLIVLPIWGISEYPSNKIAEGYARHSRGTVQVIDVAGDGELFPWDEMRHAANELEFVEISRVSVERFRTVVIDVRRLLDWAERQDDIDASRIGIVGFSLGAMATTTLLGNDPRVATAVLVMGAAEYADVISHCGRRVAKTRDHVTRDFGWTVDQYRDFFADLFSSGEPEQYRGAYDPDTILLIDALYDDCVPESSRDALWELTGRPERVSIHARHRPAFYAMTPLGFNFARREIYDFLDRKL